MKLSFQKFWLILYSWTIQLPVKQTSTLTSLSEITIYDWYTKFRRHLPADKQVLDHLIQLDEAYFGGKQERICFWQKKLGQEN